VPRGQCDGSLRLYSPFSRQEPLLFFQVAPESYSQGCVDLLPDPLLLRKSGSAGNQTRTSETHHYQLSDCQCLKDSALDYFNEHEVAEPLSLTTSVCETSVHILKAL
jgi:hypothetical protein